MEGCQGKLQNGGEEKDRPRKIQFGTKAMNRTTRDRRLETRCPIAFRRRARSDGVGLFLRRNIGSGKRKTRTFGFHAWAKQDRRAHGERRRVLAWRNRNRRTGKQIYRESRRRRLSWGGDWCSRISSSNHEVWGREESLHSSERGGRKRDDEASKGPSGV